jgi:hypothetical protein
MNFTPPLRPRQLCFAFIEEREGLDLTPWARAGMGRSAFYARRRMQRAVSLAIELERRRRSAPVLRRPPSGPSWTAPARISRPVYEANELQAIASRLSRLTISRKDPHAFFEERSELVFALREIAARSCRKVW